MQIIINPGTEPQPDATEANADEIIRRFVDALAIERGLSYGRCPGLDPRTEGYYAYILRYGWQSWCQVDVPGIDPDRVQEGRPWYSPRLYVNGGSWLWGFALGIALDALGLGEDDE